MFGGGFRLVVFWIGLCLRCFASFRISLVVGHPTLAVARRTLLASRMIGTTSCRFHVFTSYVRFSRVCSLFPLSLALPRSPKIITPTQFVFHGDPRRPEWPSTWAACSQVFCFDVWGRFWLTAAQRVSSCLPAQHTNQRPSHGLGCLQPTDRSIPPIALAT